MTSVALRARSSSISGPSITSIRAPMPVNATKLDQIKSLCTTVQVGLLGRRLTVAHRNTFPALI